MSWTIKVSREFIVFLRGGVSLLYRCKPPGKQTSDADKRRLFAEVVGENNTDRVGHPTHYRGIASPVDEPGCYRSKIIGQIGARLAD